MDTEPPQPGGCGSWSSRMAGSTSNMAIIGTLPERRHQLVHCNTPDAAAKYMTQDAPLKIVRKNGSSKYKKDYAVVWECIDIKVNGH